jgi:flagellar hook-basal body complex protein FliE
MPLIPAMGSPLGGLGGLTGPGVGGTGATGGEWSVGTLDGPGGAQPAGKSFGSVLGDQIGALEKTQNDAAAASQSLADGTATDTTSVVMAVERARLSMQVAAQLRTKGVEAINDIFHTSV